MSHVETRPEAGAVTKRRVELVDCDVHAQATEAMLSKYLSAPARRMLERYGRRTPRVTEWYPRARNAGMRVDAWPGKPGHIWGATRSSCAPSSSTSSRSTTRCLRC